MDVKRGGKVVAIVQARTGSKRLPGKVLKDIIGKPLLWHVINRLRYATLIDQIVIATSAMERDRPVVEFARDNGIACFMGSEEDVLDRYYQAAKRFNADAVVRITGDCPTIDPKVVDMIVGKFLEGNWDYVANALPPTFPDGMDTEVFTLGALERAWRESTEPRHREHVTEYIRFTPGAFLKENVTNKVDLSHIKVSVDTQKDLDLVRKVFENLYREGDPFSTEEVAALLQPNIVSQCDSGSHRSGVS